MPPHLPVAKHRVLDKVGIYIYMFNQPEKTPKQISFQVQLHKRLVFSPQKMFLQHLGASFSGIKSA